jgi:hypothetical protein
MRSSRRSVAPGRAQARIRTRRRIELMTFCVASATGQQFERSRTTCKQPLSPREIYGRVAAGRFRSGTTQTRQPTAPSKKTCKCRPSRERLKGFEPSTFCMASRTHATLVWRNNPANEPFSHPQQHAPMPGIHQETMGVPGPKPDPVWSSQSFPTASPVGLRADACLHGTLAPRRAWRLAFVHSVSDSCRADDASYREESGSILRGCKETIPPLPDLCLPSVARDRDPSKR